MPLTPNELKLLDEFIDNYTDYLTDNTCNDYDLNDTPENREIALAAERRQRSPYGENERSLRISGGKIHCSDFVILRELRWRLANSQ